MPPIGGFHHPQWWTPPRALFALPAACAKLPPVSASAHPALSLGSRLRIPNDVVLQEVGGETVLLNLRTERYFGLDEVGTTMLAALRSDGSAQGALEAALRTYDVASDTLERDLLALFAELLQHGLLEIAA